MANDPGNRGKGGKSLLNFQIADLHELIGQALYVAREEIQARKLWLRMDLSARQHTVRADPVRLGQVFWNLLKNGVQFTPVGGTLIVRSADRPKDVVRVEIQDTGVGIAPEALARIFNNPLEALEGISLEGGRMEGEGSGPGLAMCKALVELHGGRIWAESAGAGRGATFIVELPTTSAETPSDPSADSTGVPPGVSPSSPSSSSPVSPFSPDPLAARLGVWGCDPAVLS